MILHTQYIEAAGGPAPNTNPDLFYVGDLAATSYGLSLPSGATPLTKNGWQVLHASTPYECKSFELLPGSTSAGTVNSNTLIDFAVGPEGNEVPFLSNFSAGWLLGGTVPQYRFLFDYTIPAGSRVTMRSASPTANNPLRLGFIGYKAGWGGSSIVTYGTSYVEGVSIACGVNTTVVTATNTLGAWVQIATTTQDHDELLYSLGLVTTAASAGNGLLQIGIGESGAQEVILEGIPFSTTTSEDIRYPGCTRPLRRALPSGTKIWARYQDTSIAGGARPAVAVYGITD